MPRAQPPYGDAQDVDLAGLGRALWHAKGWVLGLAVGCGIVTFIGLSMVRPLYTSEARVLIQNEESAFTRPASDQGREQDRALDEQAVQSQVQVLTSRDLALEVVKDLDLSNDPAFQKDAGVNLFKRMLNGLGLGRDSEKSEREKAADAFAEHLSVFPLAKSSVIAIEYTSGDPSLAAKAANKLADVYIEWQRKAKLEQTRDATAWLRVQIDELRKKVAESEAAAEKFRAAHGLYSGGNNVTLNAQQLSELNSQLILAAAQKSEAEARARLIKTMLDEKGEVDATPEVLKSELISRLIEQRAQVQRQLAELSATLMPSHPRIKQLNSELADSREQIRLEAAKIVKGLENEAQVASARESSLRKSLNDVKTQASGMSDAEIQLRALEREAKANRDLLESYLARYQDASARHDMGSVPAQAAIVSRAHASLLPSFPKRLPMTLLATLAAALLAIAYILARELMGGTSPVSMRDTEPSLRAPPVQPAAARTSRARPARQAEPPPQPAHAAAPPAAASVAVSTPGAIIAEPPAAPVDAVEKSNPPSAPRVRPKWLKGTEMKTAEPAAKAPEVKQQSSTAGIFQRARQAFRKGDAQSQPESPFNTDDATTIDTGTAEAVELPSTRPNDLRHYLQQRVAASRREPSPQSQRPIAPRPSKAGNGRIGPVLKSLDAVLNHVVAAAKGEAPRALLVASASPKADAAAEAIEIARGFVARRERVVLVDLTRSASAVSGALGLPRAPGFTDLLAGRAGFEDVVRIDPETALQVIPAGNPTIKSDGDEVARFGRLFDALTKAYDCVVLHADYEAAKKLKPALRLELPVMVAVLPRGASAKGGQEDLSEFVRLGCPIVVYEQDGKRVRSGFLGRVAARG